MPQGLLSLKETSSMVSLSNITPRKLTWTGLFVACRRAVSWAAAKKDVKVKKVLMPMTAGKPVSTDTIRLAAAILYLETARCKDCSWDAREALLRTGSLERQAGKLTMLARQQQCPGKRAHGRILLIDWLLREHRTVLLTESARSDPASLM